MELNDYLSLVTQYLPVTTNDQLRQKVAEVCYHAGYYEMDVAELCQVLSNNLV